jgi:hypothetical protein
MRRKTSSSRSSSSSTVLLLVLLGIVCTVDGLRNALLFGSRRDFFATVATATSNTLLSPAPSISKVTTTPNDRSKEEGTPEKNSSSLSSKLLSIIPATNSGAPATNATITNEVTSEIEDFVSLMERTTNQKNNAQSPLLSGSWRLLYSNAPEIVSLSKGLPLGFALGPTYQPLDTDEGFFENTARLDIQHPFQLAAIETIVVGTIAPGTKGSVNAAGVANLDNNRVDIRFEVIVFQIDEVLGTKLGTPIRKTLVPTMSARKNSESALPANDQTYLDERVRIVRGGDGSLFVFSRTETEDASEAPPMMTAKERADLIASSTASGSITTPVGEDLEREKQKKNSDTSIPAEIEYLFREQKR